MEPAMKDISSILHHRDNLFADQTQVLFERVNHVLNGIREYLVSVDPSYTPGTFIWEKINSHDAGELLMLLGRVEYDTGSTFILDGEMIEITEQNKSYFVRNLRIGIPVSVANQPERSATFDFLQTLRAAMEEEATQIAEEAQMMFDNNQPLSPQYDFDMDDLTEEQRQAFLIADVDGEKLN